MVRVLPWLASWMVAGCFMDAVPGGGDSTPMDETGSATTGTSDDSGSGTSSESGSPSSEDTGSTGAAMCPPATECTAVPPGWGGPYVVARSDVPCPSEATEHAATFHGDPDPAVDCGCSCGDASNTCAATASTAGGDPECNFPDQEGTLTAGNCTIFQAARYAIVSSTPTGTGSCAPSAPTNEPSVTWGRDAVLCVAADPVACDGGTCVPRIDAPFGEVCIVRDGSHTCPPEWTVGSSWYVDAADTRVCSCGCADPGGVDCNLALDIFNDTGCTDFYYSSSGASCHHGESVSAPWSLVWNPVSVGSCMPQQMIAGDLTPTAERTLCCRG